MKKETKIFGKTVSLTLNSEADESVFEEVFVDRDYKLLDDALKGVIVLDLGAHIGCFSIYASLAGADAVFAFEPEENNYKLLKENLHDNRIRNVICKNAAVSEHPGERVLNISEDSHNHSFVVDGVGTQKVRTLLLEPILVKYKCNVVKMDIEGAEYEVLESLSNFASVRTMYVEYHEFESFRSHLQLMDIFKDAGFKVSAKPSHYDKRMGFILAVK